MTTILEAIKLIYEDGLKVTTIIACIVFYRKHLSNKRNNEMLIAIAKAVGAQWDAGSWNGKRGLLKIIGQTKKSKLQPAEYAPVISAKYSTQFEGTSLSQQRRMRMKSKLLSRKFLLTILTAGIVAFNDALGWGLSQETIITISGVVVSYVAIEGTKDIVTKKPEVSEYDSKTLDDIRDNSEGA